MKTSCASFAVSLLKQISPTVQEKCIVCCSWEYVYVHIKRATGMRIRLRQEKQLEISFIPFIIFVCFLLPTSCLIYSFSHCDSCDYPSVCRLQIVFWVCYIINAFNSLMTLMYKISIARKLFIMYLHC